jgi:hypothetical protein
LALKSEGVAWATGKSKPAWRSVFVEPVFALEDVGGRDFLKRRLLTLGVARRRKSFLVDFNEKNACGSFLFCAVGIF